MRNIASLLTAVALLTAAAGVVVIAFLTLPQLEKFIRMESVRTCGQLSKFTQNIEETGASAEYPVQDVYQNCLSTLGVN